MALVMNARPFESTRDEAPAPGALSLRRVGGRAAGSYYLYVPVRRLRADLPLLVSVHGISRNAREHGRALSRLAERYGVALLSPLFARDFFPDFQRLGVDSGCRADVALDEMIDDASERLDRSLDQFALFGYSGGGQFAHRYALLRPERVAALAVASPGSRGPPSSADFPMACAPGERSRGCAVIWSAF